MGSARGCRYFLATQGVETVEAGEIPGDPRSAEDAA
jgi:hypothetical protein